jgi:uncharacterized protein DUF3658/uncharacterized protein DUF1835
VFSPSAAGSLNVALRKAHRPDRVACQFDNLALGPINPPDHRERLAWMEHELRWSGLEDVLPAPEAFWDEALSEDVRKVAWLSRRSAPEYCAFLEWLWRLGDKPCEVIDLTDMPVGSRRRAFSLVLLHPEEIADNRLWDSAAPLDGSTRERFQSLWRRLRAENAPLRVADADGLQSAPITFFDQQLLSFAKSGWQKPARIIGEVMAEWVMPEMEPYFQAGDGILSARIPDLVERGLLEGRGNLLDIRGSEVRLPTTGRATA